jgi:hypothetical protein
MLSKLAEGILKNQESIQKIELNLKYNRLTF